MELLVQLKRNFTRESAPAPHNLRELNKLLQNAAQTHSMDPSLAGHCSHWYSEVDRIYQANQLEKTQTRGQLHQLWLEQAEICVDLLNSLQEARTVLTESRWRRVHVISLNLDHQIEDLQDNISAIQHWRRSGQHRCLRCGWDAGEPGQTCPHCGIHCLKPVQTEHDSSHLGSIPTQQSALFDSMIATLEGRQDALKLLTLLRPLEAEYACIHEQLCQLPKGSPVVEMADNVADVLAALQQMEEVCIEWDGQCLEDGWHRLRQADHALSRCPLLSPDWLADAA